ncbi:MAG: adenosine deaminase [Clostridia bacterium]|nr:adenosine deaminase [Clostridia bacterium]
MIFFQRFYLDREKDIVVDLYMEGERLLHVIHTPNHHTGNLISNLARLCALQTSEDENGLKVIRGEVPSYYDGDNRRLYILRLGNTKVANIWPDGRVELKASVPAISKTLMSQTKDYRLGIDKTIVKTYIPSDCKFRTDLHTHMNGNLPPDVLIALAIVHQIRYPYYYIKKLGLKCTPAQIEGLEARRVAAGRALGETTLTGRHRERRIDDYTFINFADLILGNPADAAFNIERVRNSLTIPKDGQAVFANLEKVYLYRYVFTKGVRSDAPFSGLNIDGIPDREVAGCAAAILRDREDDRYRANTLYQDLLLWIAREYQRRGVEYVEITDTALLNRADFPSRLRQIHEIMPAITRETGVLIRFLAGIRRIPLTIVRDRVTPNDYLLENMRCLRAIAADPYVAGSDIIGEEINDILELRSVIRELVAIAGEHPGFVIRIHAGENDSLRDNVANSIRCVAEALAPGQAMPPLRVGHGLYTCDLRGAKGRRLLEDMVKYGVTLEFQITSNVRLNNLSRLERHPLRQYLKAGVRCVQGTDGGALYGTNSIDEELSLEKLLSLSHGELLAMRHAEDDILAASRATFADRLAAFRRDCPGRDVELYYQEQLESAGEASGDLWRGSDKLPAEQALADRIAPLPEAGFPIVVAGGSFNNSQHRTALRAGDRAVIDALLARLDPGKVFFVVGHTLTGQEGYLARQAAGCFRVYAIVPTMVSRSELNRLRASGVAVRMSIESSGMGLYKSFAYEIFKRMPSALLAFDGNSAALNLIQEARNGRRKCRIYINPKSRGLAAKARLLEGYVSPLGDPDALIEAVNRFAGIHDPDGM